MKKPLKNAVFFLSLIFYMCLFIVSVCAEAELYNGICSSDGSVYWMFTDEGRLTVEGEGEMDCYTSFSRTPYAEYISPQDISSVKIGDGVRSTGAYAFSGCSAEQAELSSAVKTIGAFSFFDCDNLSELFIPASVSTIEENAFTKCDCLNILVAEASAYFTTDEKGILYNKDMTEIIFCPASADLESFTLPYTVTKIRSNAFYGVASLESLTLTSSIAIIEEGAFEGCDKLSEIYYISDEQALSLVALEGSGLENKEIVCNYCTHPSQSLKEGLSASCLTPGYSDYYVCDLCSAVLTQRNVIFADHTDTDSDGICDLCLSPILEPVCSGFLNIKQATIYYALYSDGTLSLYGEGAMKDYQPYTSDFNHLSLQVKRVEISDKISHIGAYSFYDFQLLETVSPGGAATVGEGAFENARALRTVEGTDCVTRIEKRAFALSGLQHLDFPCAVTIGEEAFYGCAFEEIYLPSPLTSVGDRGFFSCTRAKKVRINENLSFLGEDAFSYCTGISEFSVLSKNSSFSCREGVLYDYSGKKLIKYPPASENTCYTTEAATEEICTAAFEGCCLTEIILNDNLKSISNRGFSDCDALVSVTLPPYLTCIGEGAFSYCDSLESIELSSSLSLMGSFAFARCLSLKEISVPHALKEIPAGCFYGCKSLESVALDSLTEKINANAFSLCQGLSRLSTTRKTAQGITVEPQGNEAFLTLPLHYSDHSTVAVEKREPLCIYDGCEKGVYCNDCLCVLSGCETIKAEYTDHDYQSPYTIREATCTEKGELRADCSRCDAYTLTDIPLAPHIYSTSTAPATCTRKGYTVYYCSCGDRYTSDITPLLPHSMGEYEISEKATCTKEGTKISRCKDCSYTLTRQVPTLEHSYKKVSVTAPTCTKKGYTLFKCSCGKALKDRYTKALGHKKESYTLKATLSKNGSYGTKCSRCEKLFSSKVIYKISSVTLSFTECTYNAKLRTPSVTVKSSKGKKLKKNRDYSISYESGRKNPGIYKITLTFKGSYKGKKVLRLTILPKSVTSCEGYGTGKTVNLSWSRVKGASGYRIYYYDSKKKKYLWLKDTRNTSLTVKALGGKALSYGKDYTFRIRAFSKAEDKLLFSKKKATVKVSLKPGKASLTSLKKKGTSITVRWKKQSCDGYEIVCAANKSFSSKKTVNIKKSDTLKHTLTNLTKGRVYYVKLRAYKIIKGEKVYGYYSSPKKLTL